MYNHQIKCIVTNPSSQWDVKPISIFKKIGRWFRNIEIDNVLMSIVFVLIFFTLLIFVLAILNGISNF